MIAPRWGRPRLGPWLRGERDKRLYGRLFTNVGYVAGLGRMALLTFLQKEYCSPDLYDTDFFSDHVKSGSGRVVYVFRGMSDMFRPLTGHHEAVLAEFVKILRPRCLPAPDVAPKRFVAVHVRMGDFAPPDAKPPRQSVSSCRRDSFSPEQDREEFLRVRHVIRLPISWYIEMLREVRSRLGDIIPALIVSDGSDEEIHQLLAEPGVTRYSPRNAAEGLLLMARVSLLIGSNSTYSEWASYLGQVPSIYGIGGIDGDLFVGNAEDKKENLACECDTPQDIPACVIKASYERLLAPSVGQKAQEDASAC